MAKRFPYKFDTLKKRAALGLFAAGWTKQDVALAIGVRPQTIYNTLKADQEFAANVKIAIDTRDAHVEAALLANALKGNVVAQIFWLKNRQPQQWRDVQQQQVESRSVVLHVVYDPSPEEKDSTNAR